SLLKILLCVLDLILQNEITPTATELFAAEGETVTFSCKYSGSVQYLHWYQQHPGSEPEFLILKAETGSHQLPKDHPRVSVAVDKEGKRVHLKLLSAAVTDSALYYCALTPTVTGNSETQHRNQRNTITLFTIEIIIRMSHTSHDTLQIHKF
uniref:Ig-like domain-containing protein n=1 Tax=Denticeps clupeoides TaxID=299321 RepID=A0AAY4ACW4_9TELE